MAAIGAVLIGGCAQRRTHYEPPELRSVYFTARAELFGNAGDSIRIRAVGRNTGAQVVQIVYGASCNMSARAESMGQSRSGSRRVWDYHAMLTAKLKAYNMDFVCLLSALSFPLLPGDSTTLQLAFSVRDVRGDSLPSGTYEFTALLGVMGLKKSVLPAGRLELSPPL